VITERILGIIEESGVLPWSQPWDLAGELPRNLRTKKAYKGYNVWSLLFEQQKKGYTSSWWVTYKQAQALGGSVRNGEKSTVGVNWHPVPKKDKETGEETGEVFMKPSLFWVFNFDQCDDLVLPEKPQRCVEPLDHCEKIGSAMALPIEIRHGGDRAFYRPSEDFIMLPNREQFHSTTEYYSTRFHEMVHSTGHEKRLNRSTLVDMVAFGDQNYSKEELVAELGAAFICGFTGIENTASLKNSAAYLKGWSEKLRGEPKLFTSAASAAQKALDYILGKDALNAGFEIEEDIREEK
jgi:antirestriction protein ArdC